MVGRGGQRPALSHPCASAARLLAPRTGGLPRWVRGLYAAAWVLSLCNMLTLAAVDPIVDEAERNPLYGFAYGRLAKGHYPHRLDAGNVGVLLGLLPPWDLVAFVLAFGGWTIGLLRSTRAADRQS